MTDFIEIEMVDTTIDNKEKYFELPKDFHTGKYKIRLLPSIVANGTYGAFSTHTYWYDDKAKILHKRKIKIKKIVSKLKAT